jgi:hypothetical protein
MRLLETTLLTHGDAHPTLVIRGLPTNAALTYACHRRSSVHQYICRTSPPRRASWISLTAPPTTRRYVADLIRQLSTHRGSKEPRHPVPRRTASSEGALHLAMQVQENGATNQRPSTWMLQRSRGVSPDRARPFPSVAWRTYAEGLQPSASIRTRRCVADARTFMYRRWLARTQNSTRCVRGLRRRLISERKVKDSCRRGT